MTAVAFDHIAPTDLDAAVRALATDGTAVPLAGGQSLVPMLARRAVRPDLVVDLAAVPELAEVRVGSDEVRIGAMARIRTLERDPGVRAVLPVLAQACGFVAHPHVRARSTLGGSLCQAAPGAELPAVAVALGARLVLRSAAGVRAVPAARFATGPGSTGRFPEELLTEVVFPRRTGIDHRFAEFGDRSAGGYPLVGVCTGLVVRHGTIRRAEITATGVGPVPARLPAVESRFVGRTVTGARSRIAPAIAAESALDGAPGAEHRRALLGVLLGRLLTDWAAERPDA